MKPPLSADIPTAARSAALLALAPLLLAADGFGRGLDLSLLAALVLLPALALQRLIPAAARAQASALVLIAATATAAGGWLYAALLPQGFALAALAPLLVANVAWWQQLARPEPAPPLIVTAVLCLAPAGAGLLREAMAAAALLQPLAREPATLFVLAACVLAAGRTVLSFAATAGTTDA